MYVKTMYFKTKLTAAQIKIIFQAQARPRNFSNTLTGDIFIYKFMKDKFYLSKTSMWGDSRFQVPFVGRIIEREGGSIIVGKFSTTKAARILMGFFLAFGCFNMLLPSFKGVFDIWGTALIVFALCCWSLLGFALIEFLPRLFFQKKEGDVIEFIQKNLEANQVPKEEALQATP